jgi:hypothetical protein
VTSLKSFQQQITLREYYVNIYSLNVLNSIMALQPLIHNFLLWCLNFTLHWLLQWWSHNLIFLTGNDLHESTIIYYVQELALWFYGKLYLTQKPVLMHINICLSLPHKIGRTIVFSIRPFPNSICYYLSFPNSSYNSDGTEIFTSDQLHISCHHNLYLTVCTTMMAP